MGGSATPGVDPGGQTPGRYRVDTYLILLAPISHFQICIALADPTPRSRDMAPGVDPVGHGVLLLHGRGSHGVGIDFYCT